MTWLKEHKIKGRLESVQKKMFIENSRCDRPTTYLDKVRLVKVYQFVVNHLDRYDLQPVICLKVFLLPCHLNHHSKQAYDKIFVDPI